MNTFKYKVGELVFGVNESQLPHLRACNLTPGVIMDASLTAYTKPETHTSDNIYKVTWLQESAAGHPHHGWYFESDLTRAQEVIDSEDR